LTKDKSQLIIQTQAFASQLIPAIIGVLSFTLLARSASQNVFGQFVIYLAAIVTFEMIKSGGLQSAIIMRVSGSQEQLQLKVIGSAYWLGGIISIIISVILLVLFFSNIFINQPGIQLFCGLYACMGIVTLPLHVAEASAVVSQDLKFLLFYRIFQSCSSLCIALYSFFGTGTLKAFATIHLSYTCLLVLVVLVLKKANPLHIKFRAVDEIKELFRLVRFTIVNFTTTNLLKSADTFLIGSLMGVHYVAMYAVPMKLTELFEIPLRSLTTTAYPQLSACHNQGDKVVLRKKFIQYLSWCYILYIPALCVAFALAPFLVVLLGGQQYAGTAIIFRVFILYGLLLPADRLTGISLDAIQKPHHNFVKIIIMASINIIGDVVAIQYFGKLEWVAFASVLNAATGAFLGYWMLQRTGELGQGKVVAESFEYSRSLIQKNIQRFFNRQN
jgi:O-antigen/teichoic acid export membrane protein